MSDKESICILITGMPYSGKSIPAGVLHHFGAHLGHFSLSPDSIYNRHDYFEHPQIVDMHSDITGTRSLSGMYDAISDIHDCKKSFSYDDITENAVEVIVDAIIKNRIRKRLPNKVWGLKDPRLCLPEIAQSFHSIASQFSNVKLIVCERKHRDVIRCNYSAMMNSKMEVTFNDVVEYVRRWQTLVDNLYYSFSCPKMKIYFEDFSNEDFSKFHIKRLSQFVGLPITESAKLFLEKRREYIENNGN